MRHLFSLCPVKIVISLTQCDGTSGERSAVGDIRTVINSTQVLELTECIARQFQPERIILFGSYAYGVPDENSDVDLLVTMPHGGRNSGQAVKILSATAPQFALDLLVRTPEEVEKRPAMNDFFLREVVEKGKVLYDVSHG